MREQNLIYNGIPDSVTNIENLYTFKKALEMSPLIIKKIIHLLFFYLFIFDHREYIFYYN